MTTFRAVIAASFFLVLISVALLFSGGAAIQPLLRSALASRDANGIGDVVITMPGGKVCRHVSFDNATSEMAEDKLGACPEDVARGAFRSYRGFAWGAGNGGSDR